MLPSNRLGILDLDFFLPNTTDAGKRHHLMKLFGDHVRTVAQRVRMEDDSMQTYLAFKRYMEAEHGHLSFPSRRKLRAFAKDKAELMIALNIAYRGLVASFCDRNVRLSIHLSGNYFKFGVSLVAGWSTPWVRLLCWSHLRFRRWF